MKFILISLMLFLFGRAFSFAQLNELKAEVLNMEQNIPIEQYRKVEIGIRLPKVQDKKVRNFTEKASIAPEGTLNPYLQWELDVEVSFTHMQTGRTFQVPGFYYQEYRRDTFQNKYMLMGTGYSFRARFAPPLEGLWTYQVSVSENETFVANTEIQNFYVTATDSKGFVKVDSKKKNLKLGEELFYPVGQNLPYPYKDMVIYNTILKDGQAPYTPKTTHLVAKPSDWIGYLKDVSDFAKQGGIYLRTLQAAFSNLIEFEEKGDYTKRLHLAWEQDRLMELCEKEGLYVSFNLMQQEPFMKYGNYDMFDWDWSSYEGSGYYNKADRFPRYAYSNEDKKEPYEMFLDKSDLDYHKQRTRYYMARYAYSTAIYQFEILSEPWHLGQLFRQPEPYFEDSEFGALTRKAVANYENTMADYIRGELPFVQQLLGIDVAIDQIYKGNQFLDSAMYNPNVDIIGFNPYSSIADKLLISKSGSNNEVQATENSMYAMIARVQALSLKPIMIFEGGPTDDHPDLTDYKSLKIDLLSFGYSGIAGYNEWIGYTTNLPKIWGNLIQAEKTMNTPLAREILMSNWQQGREKEYVNRKDEKALLEMQYYLSENGLLAMGYIKNRSYNVFTTQIKSGLPVECIGDPFYANLKDIQYDESRKIKVEGLGKGKYIEITYFNYLTGEILLTEKVKAKRNFRLKFPELSVTQGKAEQPILNFEIKVLEQ